MKKRSPLLKRYSSDSPNHLQQEDDDGSFYPKHIQEPEISFIPLAEPQVIITDIYEKPKDWYYIPEAILEFAEQAYVAYYQGLYFASFMCSINCLELTLKYELIRKNPPFHQKLEGKFNFSEAIKSVNTIGLTGFSNRLNCVNDARNGLFHFNPKNLKKSIHQMRKESLNQDVTDAIIGFMTTKDIGEIEIDELGGDLSYYLDNVEWSNMAFYAYSLMYDITKELYGEYKKIGFIKYGLDDYRKRQNITE